jgi:hypothetical protein
MHVRFPWLWIDIHHPYGVHADLHMYNLTECTMEIEPVPVTDPLVTLPKPKPKTKAVRKGRPLVRTCRMGIRLAPKELAKLKRIAKAKDISATAMLVRLIEKAA